jgi:hypothetical protein
MSSKTTTRLLWWALIVSMVAFYTCVIIYLRQEEHKADIHRAQGVEMVQLVCMRAHNETDGDSEEACGLAQDQTRTEFLCSRSGTCWVEQK